MLNFKDSYLILRNVDFVAKYFPFFLQTSIRANFSLEMIHPKMAHFLFNTPCKTVGGKDAEGRRKSSSKVLDTLSLNHSDDEEKAMTPLIASTSLLSRVPADGRRRVGPRSRLLPR